jgi:hypothetical protein
MTHPQQPVRQVVVMMDRYVMRAAATLLLLLIVSPGAPIVQAQAPGKLRGLRTDACLGSLPLVDQSCLIVRCDRNAYDAKSPGDWVDLLDPSPQHRDLRI